MSICPDDDPEIFEKIYHFMLAAQAGPRRAP
jgi:hypothetical protein